MYDLIIVGGGPSGSSAGRIAGKNGLNTLLIEKEAFPRYKPCGGALSEHARSYLDFDIPDSIIEKEVHGGKICFSDSSIERFKDYRLSIMVTRSIFDDYLLEKAKETGIEVHNGEKVISIMDRDDHVEIKTDSSTYRSRFVIISTGSQGTLKNTIREKDKKNEYGVCIVTEVQEDNKIIDEKIKNSVELHFGVSGMGYGWIFPHDNYYSVGIGSVDNRLADPKLAMRNFLVNHNFNGKYKLNGHIIPCGGYKRDLVKGRVMLSGDAAGFVDAFTGEGMAYAIRSGQLAVEVISENSGNDAKFLKLKEYEKRCYSEFGEHLKYSLLFAKIMHRFPKVTLRAFASESQIVDNFFDVISFKMSYKEYLKWLLFNFKLSWLKNKN
ncbi:geranylgeranyl reductase family protein [Methanolobus sp. ZRKC3]|uniref:geranylgeranyl reductase family protein n=1 Tax=Methanolobus sp. ZRKC3 TaxID=3125786 RepID=UPI003243B004